MSYFKNKKVLVTGGASGIGFLMGKKALNRGASHLILWDINEDALLSSAATLTKLGFSVSTGLVDVRNHEQVQEEAEKVLSQYEKVDVLINNAGIVVGKSFHEHSYEDIDMTMGVNSLGLMFAARAFLPAMIEARSGQIVNIASAAGLTPNPHMTVYAASKWAALGWSDSLRLELAEISKDLRVLTVQPSYINTGMFAGVKSPRLVPLLDPDVISVKILDAVEKNKIHLREPFMVKLTPFFRGLLPARLYDFVAGKIFKVYESMSTFIGRNQKVP